MKLKLLALRANVQIQQKYFNFERGQKVVSSTNKQQSSRSRIRPKQKIATRGEGMLMEFAIKDSAGFMERRFTHARYLQFASRRWRHLGVL